MRERREETERVRRGIQRGFSPLVQYCPLSHLSLRNACQPLIWTEYLDYHCRLEIDLGYFWQLDNRNQQLLQIHPNFHPELIKGRMQAGERAAHVV